MSFYKKYIKYKMKYIELQKIYLIGGGKESAKNYFIKNFPKYDTVVRGNLINDQIINSPNRVIKSTDTPEQLFEIIYAKLLELLRDVKQLNKYIDFIIKSYLNNTFGTPSSLENLGRFNDNIKTYETLQNNKRFHKPAPFVLLRLDQLTGLTTLEDYLTTPDIEEILTAINAAKTNAAAQKALEVEKKELGETDPILETSNVLIYNPTTEQQSKYYGRNTRWCTAANTKCMFNKYNNEGPLYIFISKHNEKIKFQLHIESNSLMDDRDKPVTIKRVLAAFNNDNDLILWLKEVLLKPKFMINIQEDRDITQLTIHKTLMSSFLEYNKILYKVLNGITNKDKINTIQIDINIKLGDILSKFKNLKTLEFPQYFNQPLDNSLLGLNNLDTLKLEGDFNQQLLDSLLSLVNLKYLRLGNNFNHPLGGSLSSLVNLNYLRLGDSFNHPLRDSLLSLVNLNYLRLGDSFNYPLGDSLSSLVNLNYLILGDSFNYPLGDSLSRLKNLEYLTLGSNSCEEIGNIYDSFRELEGEEEEEEEYAKLKKEFNDMCERFLGEIFIPTNLPKLKEVTLPFFFSDYIRDNKINIGSVVLKYEK